MGGAGWILENLTLLRVRLFHESFEISMRGSFNGTTRIPSKNLTCFHP